MAKRVVVLGVKGITEAKLLRVLPFNHPEYNIVGIADDDPSLAGCSIAGIPVIGTASQILGLAQSREIDLIVVTMRQRRGCLPIQALLNCRTKGIRVIDLPEFYEEVWGKLMLEYPRSSWLIFNPGFKSRDKGIARLLERLLELTWAGLLLAVLLPAGLLAAVCMGITSGGGIFRKTPCIGQHGIEFERLSFACPDSQFGRFWQHLKLPDWPMLINVLLGQMSWVGISRYDPSQRDNLQKYPLFCRRLMELKPGIINWAGVNRANGHILEFREQLEFDLYYLKHYSWWLDMKVLFKGLKELFRFDFTAASDCKEVNCYVEAKH